MTSAPAPSPCEENGCTDTDNCDEICDHSRIYSPIQIEDAKKQAAAQAREDVMKKVCSQCPIKNEEMPLEDYSAESCEGCLIRKVVESLRTEAHP